MRILVFKTFGILIFGWTVSAPVAAAPVSAKKDGVQVTAEPKKDAQLLLELKKGEALDASDREGMYWKVKTKDGKVGYVSVMAVQRQAGDDAGIQGALREAALAARKSGDGDGDSTRARSAVMGVRGLDESSETAAVGTIRPDLRAVYRMEDRVVVAKRVDKIENLVAKEIENTASGKMKSDAKD